MKKVINLLFISFISLTLASCNSNPTSSEIGSSEQNTIINPVSSSTYDIDFANSLKSIKISEKQSAKELLVEQLGSHVVSYDMYNLYYDGGALKFGSSSCGGDLEIELDITITSATFKVKTYTKSYQDTWSSSEVKTIYNIDHTELVVNGIGEKLPYEENKDSVYSLVSYTFSEPTNKLSIHTFNADDENNTNNCRAFIDNISLNY
jgi:hypothetical protein